MGRLGKDLPGFGKPGRVWEGDSEAGMNAQIKHTARMGLK